MEQRTSVDVAASPEVVGRLYRRLAERYLAMEAAGLKARAEGGAR